MLKRLLTICLTVGVVTAAISAQENRPTENPVPGKSPTAPMDVTKRRNVNIEIAITDQAGTAEPLKKVVTMIVSDRHMGSVRSSGNVVAPIEGSPVSERRIVILNVDASPVVHSDGSMLLTLNLEYVPRPEDAPDTLKKPAPAELKERMAVTLESGKPMVISRAADPGSNRRITVEVTATVMK